MRPEDCLRDMQIMSRRIQARRGNGRWTRNTFENVMGLHVPARMKFNTRQRYVGSSWLSDQVERLVLEGAFHQTADPGELGISSVSTENGDDSPAGDVPWAPFGERRSPERPQGPDLDAAYTRLRCARAAYQGAVAAFADDKTLAEQLARAEKAWMAAYDALERLRKERAI